MSKGPLPLISVCIANYNGEKLLPDCIESVLGQQGEFELELIIHDDASTDDSLNVLSKYLNIVVIKSENNVGFCVANNRMAKQANGHYLLLLNNDAALYPDALATFLSHACQSNCTKVLSLPQYDWETGVLVDRGCMLDPFHVPVPNLNSNQEQVAYVIGACLWIARENWLRLGGFPEWMESIAEDLFICTLARLQGMQVEVARTSGYRHRQGASFGGNRAGVTGLSTNYRRRYLSERNRAAILWICTPSLVYLPWMLAHILMLSLEGIALSMFKKSMKPWREIYGLTLTWLWQQRATLKAARRNIQNNKKIGIRAYIKKSYILKLRKLDILIRHGVPRLR